MLKWVTRSIKVGGLTIDNTRLKHTLIHAHFTCITYDLTSTALSFSQCWYAFHSVLLYASLILPTSKSLKMHQVNGRQTAAKLY